MSYILATQTFCANTHLYDTHHVPCLFSQLCQCIGLLFFSIAVLTDIVQKKCQWKWITMDTNRMNDEGS